MSASLVETAPDERMAVKSASSERRKRVVIVGGGFAGLAAARALRHADAEVVLALPQLQSRLRVQRQWLWSYFTGQRSSRLIPEPPSAPGGETA